MKLVLLISAWALTSAFTAGLPLDAVFPLQTQVPACKHGPAIHDSECLNSALAHIQ